MSEGFISDLLKPAIRTRFWSKVEKSEGCWEWRGGIKPNGYGDFFVSPQRRHVHPHRLVMEPIPAGLVVDHLCRNRACVNPAHLELVTQQENLRRGENAQRRKTHCVNGHPLSGANLRITPRQRMCKACQNASSNRRYHERRPNAAYRI